MIRSPTAKHKRQQPCPLNGLTVPTGVLKPLLKDHLKLTSENDLRSEDQEPAFVERGLELIGEVHGGLAHPVNG